MTCDLHPGGACAFNRGYEPTVAISETIASLNVDEPTAAGTKQDVLHDWRSQTAWHGYEPIAQRRHANARSPWSASPAEATAPGSQTTATEDSFTRPAQKKPYFPQVGDVLWFYSMDNAIYNDFPDGELVWAKDSWVDLAKPITVEGVTHLLDEDHR